MDSQFSRAERLAWSALTGALALTGAAAAICLFSRSLAVVPVLLGNLALSALTLLVAIRYRLASRRETEARNLRIYREEHPGTELFADSDEALKLAERAFRSYGKIAAPVLSVAVALIVLFAGLLIWRRWLGLAAPAGLLEPARFAILAALLFVASFLAGSFLVGASRDGGGRWLRPCGAWLFMSGFLWAVAAVALFVEASSLKLSGFGIRAAFFGLGAVLILAGELIVGVVIEFYRPRRAGEEDCPVFESRLLGLLTEPGGIARNVAASLDYQFGFKISEGAFYRFLGRSLLPLVLFMVAMLWLSTSLVVVDTEENGIRERFGRVADTTPLGPGLYGKLPWPFGHIYTYPVHRVQQLPVGYKEGSVGKADEPPGESPEEVGDMTGRIIVWGKKHNLEEVNFVVASRPDEAAEAAPETGAQSRVPVSTYFLSVSMPLFFKVNNLYDYAYRHQNPNHVLEEIATEELAKYCAQVEFFDLLTKDRELAAGQVAERIQAKADRLELGVDIVFLGLHGAHPPVLVGAAFNEVVSASEEKHTAVISAETGAASVVAQAEGDASTILAEADSYTYDRTQVSQAEAERFLQQQQAYLASPELFPLRSLLTVLEEEAAVLRKYIVAVKGGREVIILNLEEKLRPDLLDIDLERKEE